MRWWILLCTLCSLWVLTTPMSSARADFDELRFRATDTRDVDFFRVFVGQSSRRYPVQISLHDVSFDSRGVATARVPQFADLFRPGQRYFLAMTTVSVSGLQSTLSEEFVIEIPSLPPTPAPMGPSDPAPPPQTAPAPPPGEILRFRAVSPENIDHFRVFVGVQSRRYGTVIEVRDVTFDSRGVATARVPEFKNLFRPGMRYFIAMTTVDLAGQQSALSGEFVLDTPAIADQDRDGVADDEDNCPFTANPSQSDRGGVATPADPMGLRPDGIGDVCQCGDVILDGRVTRDDAVALFQVLSRRQERFAVLSEREGRTVFEPFVTRTCNVSGDDLCDASDAFALASAALGRFQLSQSCQAATPR